MTFLIKRKKITAVVLLAFLFLGFLFVNYSLEEGKVEYKNLRLGFGHETLESLIVIAKEKGFFKDEGLNVSIVEYTTGKLALLGLFNDETDISNTAEVPIVFNSFERDDFKIITTLGSADDQMKVLARKDHGITKPEDLKGKKVATQQGSAAHVFMHMFLVNYGLDESDVEVVFKKAPLLKDLVVSGEVDALIIKDPIISNAKSELGDKAIVFTPRNIYYKSFHSVAKTDYIESNPDIIKSYLKALLKAKDFLDNNKEEALNLVANSPLMDKKQVLNQWDTVNVELSLKEWLLLSMEDEARWALDNELVKSRSMPNYLDYIHTDSLEELSPSLINIIH